LMTVFSDVQTQAVSGGDKNAPTLGSLPLMLVQTWRHRWPFATSLL